MPTNWPEFLEDLEGRYQSLPAFAFNWWQYNVPLLDRIREILPPPARILEVGTGTGANAVLLAAHGYEVVGIDSNPRVVQGARSLAEYFRVRCRFEVADGLDLRSYQGQFDLAFSSGVVEHLQAGEAVQMIREKGRAAALAMVVVPTWFALRNDPLTAPSGARAIPMRELKTMCRQAGLTDLKVFGYGTPDGRFSLVYRYVLPPVLQWVLQNRMSYACTIGCLGRSRPHGGSEPAGE